MKRYLALTCTLLALSLVDLAVANTYADGLSPRYKRDHYRVADFEDNHCRLGWWQTLRFGRVHPRWGIRCR
jgi:hypothetical protein